MTDPHPYQTTRPVNATWKGECMQRIEDWLRERAIVRMGEQIKDAFAAKDFTEARRVQKAWMEAINSRSPQQCARMERKAMRSAR